jgi:hypothetical protein
MLTVVQVGKVRIIARHPTAISSTGLALTLTNFLLEVPLVTLLDPR